MLKARVVLVTCANSRGIYLDLVPDCTLKCCVDALKRFVNSRGALKIVISDNGKYFTSTDIQNFATSSGIYWKFNIESAPWYGGFFERLLKSVKRCLKKQLRKASIDYDEMITVLKEIESVINRNISYTYFESDLTEAITPNKLLYGRNLEVINTLNDTSPMVDLKVTKQEEYLETLLKHFLCRWTSEYLTELCEHQSWSNKNKINFT